VATDRSKIGDATKRHPLPMRLRNCNVPKDLGGSFGYRGAGWTQARERALKLAKNRSSVSGMTGAETKLEVDHIIPYRVGGGSTWLTNTQRNLRVTDEGNNAAVDMATSFAEKKRKRTMRKF
jgi:hypothetical protein